MSLFAAIDEVPRNYLTGPVGIAPRETDGRVGKICIDMTVMPVIREAGAKLRQFLPAHARIVDVQSCMYSHEWQILFHKPSLRKLEQGELIPRWTLMEPNGPGTDPHWWEEVK